MSAFRMFVLAWVTVTLVFFGVLVFVVPRTAGAASELPVSSTGLETWADHLGLLIGEIQKDPAKIGLSEDQVQAKVELRLRQAGVIPTEPVPAGPHLVVDIDVVGSAFAVSLFFNRRVEFTDARGRALVQVAGTTWHRRVVGTHGGSGAYILNGLDQLLDLFLDDYRKVNPR